MQKLLREMLTRLGHDVVVARDGQQALKLANGQAFDLILLDLIMPNFGGLEACTLIRRAGSQSATSFVVALSVRPLFAIVEINCMFYNHYCELGKFRR